MKTKSQKEKVLAILRRDSQISNIDCISGVHGFISLRLGAIIYELKSEEKIELSNDSGFREGTKDWIYKIKPIQPKNIIEYRVGGELKHTKTIW